MEEYQEACGKHISYSTAQRAQEKQGGHVSQYRLVIRIGWMSRRSRGGADALFLCGHFMLLRCDEGRKLAESPGKIHSLLYLRLVDTWYGSSAKTPPAPSTSQSCQ